MSKEELEKEAREWSFRKKYAYGYTYTFEQVLNAYIAGAEPREKQIDELKAQTKVLEQNLEDTEICENGLKNRIAELEDKLANADYQLEGRDNEIKELEAQLEREKNLNQCMTDNNEQLRELIEKMKCCYNCSKWNDGQCADVPNDSSYYSADFVCKDWEIKEKC